LLFAAACWSSPSNDLTLASIAPTFACAMCSSCWSLATSSPAAAAVAADASPPDATTVDLLRLDTNAKNCRKDCTNDRR
jgi:hypothetical protein